MRATSSTRHIPDSTILAAATNAMAPAGFVLTPHWLRVHAREHPECEVERYARNTLQLLPIFCTSDLLQRSTLRVRLHESDSILLSALVDVVLSVFHLTHLLGVPAAWEKVEVVAGPHLPELTLDPWLLSGPALTPPTTEHEPELDEDHRVTPPTISLESNDDEAPVDLYVVSDQLIANAPDAAAWKELRGALNQDGQLAILLSDSGAAPPTNMRTTWRFIETPPLCIAWFMGRTFGHHEFRLGQAEIIGRMLRGQPTLGVLPTGAGKSACFQLAAILLPGFSIIVSPLKSLILDQIDNLDLQGLALAEGISSADSDEKKKLALARMRSGSIKMLYASPERLWIRSFKEDLKAAMGRTHLDYVVVDEAHCVSEWGHDFRPAYEFLHAVIKDLSADTPIAALTATASKLVRSDILATLRLPPESLVAPAALLRPEIAIEMRKVAPNERAQAIAEELRQVLPVAAAEQTVAKPAYEAAALVFAPYKGKRKSLGFDSIRSADTPPSDETFWSAAGAADRVSFLRDELIRQGIPDIGEYFSVDSHQDREEVADIQRNTARDFRQNELFAIVATKGFGMGIDKPNIRRVVHSSAPESLEAYYQQAGRAARDGKSAKAIFFHDAVYSHHENDPKNRCELDPANSTPPLAPGCAGNWKCALPAHQGKSYCSAGRQAGLLSQNFPGRITDGKALFWVLYQLECRRSSTISTNRSVSAESGSGALIPMPNRHALRRSLARLHKVGIIVNVAVDYHGTYAASFHLDYLGFKPEKWIEQLVALADRERALRGTKRRRKGQNYPWYDELRAHQKETDRPQRFMVLFAHAYAGFVYDSIAESRWRSLRVMEEFATLSAGPEPEQRTCRTRYLLDYLESRGTEDEPCNRCDLCGINWEKPALRAQALVADAFDTSYEAFIESLEAGDEAKQSQAARQVFREASHRGRVSALRIRVESRILTDYRRNLAAQVLEVACNWQREREPLQETIDERMLAVLDQETEESTWALLDPLFDAAPVMAAQSLARVYSSANSPTGRRKPVMTYALKRLLDAGHRPDAARLVARELSRSTKSISSTIATLAP